MTHKPSGPENRALAEELAAQGRERRSIFQGDAKQEAFVEERARELRQQIEATKQNGRDNNGERLRELGKRHHRLTGTGGGA